MPFLLIFFLYFAIIPPAHAYIDPGTGGLIVTGILGFLAVVSHRLRSFIGRITAFFSRKRGD